MPPSVSRSLSKAYGQFLPACSPALGPVTHALSPPPPSRLTPELVFQSVCAPLVSSVLQTLPSLLRLSSPVFTRQVTAEWHHRHHHLFFGLFKKISPGCGAFCKTYLNPSGSSRVLCWEQACGFGLFRRWNTSGLVSAHLLLLV